MKTKETLEKELKEIEEKKETYHQALVLLKELKLLGVSQLQKTHCDKIISANGFARIKIDFSSPLHSRCIMSSDWKNKLSTVSYKNSQFIFDLEESIRMLDCWLNGCTSGISNLSTAIKYYEANKLSLSKRFEELRLISESIKQNNLCIEACFDKKEFEIFYPITAYLSTKPSH